MPVPLGIRHIPYLKARGIYHPPFQPYRAASRPFMAGYNISSRWDDTMPPIHHKQQPVRDDTKPSYTTSQHPARDADMVASHEGVQRMPIWLETMTPTTPHAFRYGIKQQQYKQWQIHIHKYTFMWFSRSKTANPSSRKKSRQNSTRISVVLVSTANTTFTP